MIYGSICSGVCAFTLAAKPLEWETAFFAEVEPFPSAVLMERFGATKPLRPLDPANAPNPAAGDIWRNWQQKIKKFPDGGNIPNLGDFTQIQESDYDGTIDVIVGGTPCQDFSIAGARKGMDGDRGNLALEFSKLCYRTCARWLIWENVPGVFSSNKGEDFVSFLSSLAGWNVKKPVGGWRNSGIITPAPGCYGLAWRVLDVQFTRVPGFERAIPQRRRRVFVVGYTGDWRPAAAVLFDKESMFWNNPPERKARTGVARSLTASTGGASGKENQHTFIGGNGQPLNALCVAHGQGNAEVLDGKSPSLNCNHEVPILCSTIRMRSGCEGGGRGALIGNDLSHTLGTNNDQTVVCGAVLRRLTPLECERLQGFPDNHTRIPWNGKPAEQCPDGPRYKACGNSMGVNVMRWIAMRIDYVEEMLADTSAL